MSCKIPQYFIHELLMQTDIVELINNRIKLKKKGQNYQTNCPFHDDKNPSFTVNYEKQFYYCFGCNAHGNAIDFLMNYEHLNFIETIEELSIIHGIKIPFPKIVQTDNNYIIKQRLYALMKKLSQLYQKNIFSSEKACKYLSKRKINQAMMNNFLIGFSSLNWNCFSKKFNIDKEFENNLLHHNILLVNKNGYKYDRFQGRLIFPIQDKHGRIVGFGGRSLDNSFLPKYLNSPETDIFHKGNQIYGLYQVIKKYSYPEYLLVVEGYIDVITLAQYNIHYAVSLLGTAITKKHVQKLFQITHTIIYCYDGDSSGKNAAWRALKTSLPYMSDEKILKFIILPNNEDPDTIIRKEGKKRFQERIKNATTMSKFFFKNILNNTNLSSYDDKFYLSVHALPLINSIPSATIRIYLRQILARMIGILDDHQFSKFLYEKETEKNKKHQMHIKRTAMRTLISLLVQNPELSKITPSMKKFKNLKIKGLPIFLTVLKTCIDNPNLNTGQLLEFYRDSTIINILKILARWDHMIVQLEIPHMFLDLLKKIYNTVLENRQEYLISQERIKGLTMEEKKEIWYINKKLSKK